MSSSRTTDRILTESPLPALSCLLYPKGQQSDECTCLGEISINVNKVFIVHFVYVRPCRVVVACLFFHQLFYTAFCCCLFISFSPLLFFILTVLLYFYLFVDNVNKPIIFVFGAFVYHFKNIISIFETLPSRIDSSPLLP